MLKHTKTLIKHHRFLKLTSSLCRSGPRAQKTQVTLLRLSIGSLVSTFTCKNDLNGFPDDMQIQP